jgi:hypothetical protein
LPPEGTDVKSATLALALGDGRLRTLAFDNGVEKA